ncbi:MAG TPA: hypothetical protein VE964_04490 [Myxococcales bacterium]|nr:hypothetical protein [Myxococcales bacterium]
MQDFLNPKSMATPGLAGALVMFIVNGLSVPFPDLPPRYAALGLSFAVGTLVFKAERMRVPERFMYWLVNSLIIFVVGFGTANLGHKVEVSSGEEASAVLVPARSPGFEIVRSAFAAEDAKPPSPGTLSPAQAEKLKKENEVLRKEVEQLKTKRKSEPKPVAEPEKRPFFREW